MDNHYKLNIHESFMSRALELAKKGVGLTSPNPLVGCILVKDGKIIGEGYHEKFGHSHAEINAIQNSTEDPLDATAYITLEPCCIEGKTPPCTKALIENGIKEVYIGMLDPNPRVNGQGVIQLQQSGIKVYVGILEEESKYINRAFTKWITTSMPLVIAKVAQSKDGYIGIDSDTSVWLTGEESRIHTHKLRSNVDGIMVGKNTALIDNPQLTVRKVAGHNPARIILDTNRTLPLNLNIFKDDKAETIIMCSDDRFNKANTTFCKYIPVKEENGLLSIKETLKLLAKDGIMSILVEGGCKLLTSFQDENLIDEIYIYTSSEKLINGDIPNPILISEGWNIRENHCLGFDNLIIADKNKVECLLES